jgi:hypothetical protein
MVVRQYLRFDEGVLSDVSSSLGGPELGQAEAVNVCGVARIEVVERWLDLVRVVVAGVE